MKASAPHYLVDAGPLIALLNRRDVWHDWAEKNLAIMADQLWTSEVVLAEACYNLGQNTPAVRPLLSHVASGHIKVVSVLEGQSARVLVGLMEKYEQMDLGDASPVVLSEAFPKASIITLDRRDFTGYRRFRREPLPLIMPA